MIRKAAAEQRPYPVSAAENAGHDTAQIVALKYGHIDSDALPSKHELHEGAERRSFVLHGLAYGRSLPWIR